MVYKFFDKKCALLADKYASGSGIKNENISNKELAEELKKAIIKKFEKRKVHSPFTDNIWDTNLADMQLISKFIGNSSKYSWAIPLKYKRVFQLLMLFKNILKETN